IYRTTKGEESRKDVSCAFVFTTWRFDPTRRKEYEAAKKTADSDRLAEEFGIYEVPALLIVDYHTQSFDVPAGLFRNALASDPQRQEELKRSRQPVAPLQVRVTSNDVTQYVGMARYDFYVRLDRPGQSEQLRFAVNFFKSSFGLWLNL